MKKVNEKKCIKKIDLLLLDPKNFQRLSTVGTIFIAFLLVGFVLNQYFLQNNAIAYYSILGVLIFLTVCSFVFFIFISFFKGKRFTKFNKENHEQELIDNYLMDTNVEFCKPINNDDSTLSLINGKNFQPITLPEHFKYACETPNYLLKFKDLEEPLQYVVTTYAADLKALNFTFDTTKKVVILKLNSLSNVGFYISKKSLSFKTFNNFIVNSNEFKLVDDTNFNYSIYQDVKESEPLLHFDKDVLNNLLFNLDRPNANYELYNDANEAYLICNLSSTFMDSNLRPNESIKDFNKNLKRQSFHDLMTLNALKITADAIRSNLLIVNEN